MNQALVDCIHAANETLITNGDVAAAPEFFAPDYVLHLGDRDLRGLKFVQGFVTDLRRSFADLRAEVEVLVGDGDRVAWHRTLRGRHDAAFKGFPATGKAIAWRDMVVTRFEGGLIAEEWAVSDLAEHLLAARR